MGLARRLLIGFIVFFCLSLAFLMPASVQAQGVGAGGCPAGFVPSGTTHVVNGDFSVIDTTSGIDDGGSGIIDTTLVGFSSDIPYRGYNQYPPDTYFALYDRDVNEFGGIAQVELFPGDPAYGVPPAPGLLYSNGNNYDDPAVPGTGPDPYIFWRQTVTGLSPNTTYNIYAYLNNIIAPPEDRDDPILEFLIDGTPTSLPFPVPEVPDEWVRNEITLTTGPAQTSIMLEMRENQTSINGVDLAIGMVGMEECVPDTSTNVPGISVVKVVDRQRAEVGDTVTYTYTVTNTGTVRLDPVTVSDDRLGPITLAATALDPGISTTGTAQYTIQPGDLPLTNVATASGTPPSGPPVTSTSTVTVRQRNPNPPPPTPVPNDDDDGGGSPPGQQVGQIPTLALVDPFITKSVNPPFAIPGESATWTITISNPGSIPINNVQVTDTLPAEVEILSVSASAGSVSHSGQTVSFSIGSLAPGQSVTITVQTRVRDNVAVPFIITNQACMTSTEHPDARCASATLTSVGQLPATGQSPWSPWRVPLAAGAAGLALMAASLWRRRRGAVAR